MIWDAIMTKVDVREADPVDRLDWMIGDQPLRSLDFLGNLITERLNPSSRTGERGRSEDRIGLTLCMY